MGCILLRAGDELGLQDQLRHPRAFCFLSCSRARVGDAVPKSAVRHFAKRGKALDAMSGDEGPVLPEIGTKLDYQRP
jgi:hypothetical protein